jgi:hypothetical protein
MERSHDACRSCGVHHLMGEFAVDSHVRVVVLRRAVGLTRRVEVGEVGVVREFSQYCGPLYYRVRLSDGERENFDPCELVQVDPHAKALTDRELHALRVLVHAGDGGEVARRLLQHVDAVRPLIAQARALAREWRDTSGSMSHVDAMNDHCTAVSALVESLDG